MFKPTPILSNNTPSFPLKTPYREIQNTRLYDASRRNDRNTVESILKFPGVDINYGLRGAATGGHEDMILMFIKLDAADIPGAIRNAVNYNHPSAVDTLRQYE